MRPWSSLLCASAYGSGSTSLTHCPYSNSTCGVGEWITSDGGLEGKIISGLGLEVVAWGEVAVRCKDLGREVCSTPCV